MTRPKSITDTLLEFPSEIVVKAMGHAADDFESMIAETVTAHLDGEDAAVTTLPSSKARYVSVRVRFIAQNREQLEAIYRDLHENDRVLYTL